MRQRQAQFKGLAESPVLSVLGLKRLAAFEAVRVPGEIVWFNFELARELGFALPETNLLTHELRRQLIDLLSLRALRRGERRDGREAVLLYADKYGGDDIVPCLGAGRAGFLPGGNLYLKGVGHTPLFKHDDPDDFLHSHGGAALREGMIEAVFGEANVNLFSRGSARILALIDQDDYTVYPDGLREPRAIAVRAGLQLRPAHLFARGVKDGGSKLDLFTRITRLTGQLQTRRVGRPARHVHDLRATMLRVLEDHAVTAAEQFRWRMLHGALSLSNMEMSGAMLDTTTQTSQPRTAPLRVLSYYPEIVYGTEHLERAAQLRIMYRSLVKSIPAERRQVLNAVPLDFAAEMNRSYCEQLQLQLLRAAGLKQTVAELVRADHPHVAVRFKDTLLAMSRLRNPGSVNANTPPAADVSVLDVFNLLRSYPAVYFDRPDADNGRLIRACLKPIYKGNRFRRASLRAGVASLISEFARDYAAVMKACSGLSREFYGRESDMQRSVIARASFENRPLSLLYRGHVLKQFEETVAAYKTDGAASLIEGVISDKVSASARNVDALLRRGAVLRTDDGGFELQRQTIKGVTYSVMARDSPRQFRRLRVRVQLRRAPGGYVMELTRPECFSLRELRRLKYRYALNGGRAAAEVKARVERSGHELSVNFYISEGLGLAGELAGFFYLPSARPVTLRDGRANFRGYVYAVPDRQELAALVETAARSHNCSRGRVGL